MIAAQSGGSRRACCAPAGACGTWSRRPHGMQIEIDGTDSGATRVPSCWHAARTTACSGASASVCRRCRSTPRSSRLPARRGGDVEVYFGSDTAPGGFAWTVPVVRPSGPFVRVGPDVRRRRVESSSVSSSTALGPSWGIVPELDRARAVAFCPCPALPRTYASRLLAVGDAAGLVKPTTGGGIYYSLVSAALAARDAHFGAARPIGSMPNALAVYQRRWRERLGPGVPGATCAAHAGPTDVRHGDRLAVRPRADRRRHADRPAERRSSIAIGT